MSQMKRGNIRKAGWVLFISLILVGCYSKKPLVHISDQGIAALPSEHDIVVINFWATWCEPCVEEIPVLIRLAEQRKDIRVIGISMDEVKNEALVRRFIRQHHITYPIVLRQGEDFEQMVNSIDPGWIGGLPATFVFKDGKRIYSRAGPLNEKELFKVLS